MQQIKDLGVDHIVFGGGRDVDMLLQQNQVLVKGFTGIFASSDSKRNYDKLSELEETL
jgi:hypothetical protein